MATDAIEALLTRFTDQNLANLQAACEDGDFEWMDNKRCLLGHYCGRDFDVYRKLKYHEDTSNPDRVLAQAAERQAHLLGFSATGGELDFNRAQKLLPLIHNEWARRSKERTALSSDPKPAVPAEPAAVPQG